MLNKAQKRAVDCKDSKIVCVAGAGTGKTTVLISRISKLVEEGADPESILALTFTNVAALEMKSRYTKLHPNEKSPEFRTFHSFCYSILSKQPAIQKHLGYTNTPNIAEEAAEKRIIQEAMMQTGLKLSEKKLNSQEVLTQQEAYNLMLILKASDRIMKQRNLITFNILCKSICDLFIEDSPLIQAYKQQYKYILADEFQDTDKVQAAFINSFKDANLFVVGDALQALYAFRGATSQVIKDLVADETWTTIKLQQNYRATKELCSYANRFSKSYANTEYRVTIESDKHGPEVKILGYETDYLKHGEIPTSITKEIVNTAKQLPGSSAILARTNAEVSSICEFLFAKSIPYDTVKSSSDALNLLKSILSDNYAIEWLSTYLRTNSYSEYIRRATIKGNNYSLQEFIEGFKWNTEICNRVDKIYQLRKICQDSQAITYKAQDILQLIGHKNLKVNMSEVVNNGNKLSDLIDALVDTVQSYESSASELYVGTVHSVKGLEYDNVFVIGPSGKSWPLTNEDNDNLFYVAITRAKTNLTVYFAQ